MRLWDAYFSTEIDRHEKIEWYLAQVAMAIDQSNSSKKGRRRHLKDYLIKFHKPRPAPKDNTQAKQWAMTWIKNMAGISKVPMKKKPAKRGQRK